ncbi:MAG: hypothetical protein UV05_C0023G0005 [candidate division CPR1 bacterium GW2011_GWA2_42_17]|uniref:Capsule synthesis protein CapA domain-containing protein n=1 Tax=candidate division CPR1 bacterium GW2011_GWA2_42_17 TaxID=1618341 RepID=A0A0G0Z4T8_9BACT|nr:MAG: hypothetical protein UV05_C0023G0005 [candidate division CPR1 bacterium GW2011_GWA2_42_17]
MKFYRKTKILFLTGIFLGFFAIMLWRYSLLTSGRSLIPVPAPAQNEADAHTKQILYFVPVAKFSSLKEEISFAVLQKIMTQNDFTESRFQKIYYSQENEPYLEKIFGHLANTNTDLSLVDAKNLDVQTLSLVRFDELTPRFKVLTLDRMNILDKKLDVNVWLLKWEGEAENLVSLGSTNRDLKKIASLVMTGVTAVSRGVEYEIEQRNDSIFPARAVMDVLSQADLTHVSSENPFFDSCVPETEGLILCGRSSSLKSLKAIGADIVDLTGNHQNDYGSELNLESLKHLEELGLKYYGGGKNEKQARQILYQEVSGAKIAFLGYNYFDSQNGVDYRSLALGDRPGANFYSEEKLKEDIQTAKSLADFVIVDYQFIEQYSTDPLPIQIEVFRKTIDYGADLVVGVQSHQPQKIEIYQDKLIFYGLGNFFFDQMWSLPTRQGLIPRLTFYDGKLTSVEVMTTLLYDYAQPRFTSGYDRISLLKEVLPK